MKKPEHLKTPSSAETGSASVEEAAISSSPRKAIDSPPPTEPTIKQTLQKLVAAVEELRPRPRAPKRLQEISEQLNSLLAIIAKTTGFVLMLLIVLLVVVPVVWQKVSDTRSGKETIEMEAFVVEPEIEKGGLSSQFLTHKLAAQINNIRKQVENSSVSRELLFEIPGAEQPSNPSNPIVSEAGNLRAPAISSPQEASPDIEIPGTKLSLKSFVQYVVDLFGKKSTKVAGDITRQGEGFRLIIHLTRDTEGENKYLERIFEGKNIDSLMLQAAQYVLTYTGPCMLAAYQYNSNDKDDAFISAKYCLSHTPNDNDGCYARALSGLILTDQGGLENGLEKYNEAIQEYTAAIKKCPLFVPAIINWGYTLEQQNKTDEALQKYQEALNINPKSGLAYVRRGLLFQRDKQEEKALAEFKKAATEVPDYPWSYIYWGQYYQLKAHEEKDESVKDRDYEEAIKKFKAALIAEPDFYVTYYYWGSLLAQGRRYDEAIEKYRKAIELNPGFADAYFQWGNILISIKGNYAEAREKFAKTIELDPEGLYAYLYLGATYYFEKNYEEARAYFEKEAVLAEKKGDKKEASVAYNNLGDALFDLKRLEAARDKYQKAIELDPQGLGGREACKSLKGKFKAAPAKCKTR